MPTKKVYNVHKMLSGLTTNQIKKKFCGKLIGIGTFRDVYEFKGFPNYVIKIEQDLDLKTFSNATEWMNYKNNLHWKWFIKYLAESVFISRDTEVLVMKRITFKEQKHYPKKIPVLFTDTKIQNFGWIGKQFVCCDYSFMITTIGVSRRLLKRAKWWDKGYHC